MLDSNSLNTFEWLYAHSGLFTTPALIAIVWKFSAWYQAASKTADRAVGQIDKMVTDHFPTMTLSLQKQDKVLGSVDRSLKTLVRNQVQFSTQPVIRKRQTVTRQPANRKRK